MLNGGYQLIDLSNESMPTSGSKTIINKDVADAIRTNDKPIILKIKDDLGNSILHITSIMRKDTGAYDGKVVYLNYGTITIDDDKIIINVD